MRAFIFLLILFNLLFMAWAQGYFGASSDPDALRVQHQLLADRVRIVARDEPPGPPLKAEKSSKALEKPVVDACTQLRDVPASELPRFESLLTDKFPAFKTVRSMSTDNVNHWVFIPPGATKQDADKKAAELKKLRVPEFFIVQDAGPNRFAVSLGIFSSKEAAEEHLQQLRAKGVRSAKVGEWNVKPAAAVYEIHGPEAQTDLLRQTLAEAFPGSKTAACKAQLSAAQ